MGRGSGTRVCARGAGGHGARGWGWEQKWTGTQAGGCHPMQRAPSRVSGRPDVAADLSRPALIYGRGKLGDDWTSAGVRLPSSPDATATPAHTLKDGQTHHDDLINKDDGAGGGEPEHTNAQQQPNRRSDRCILHWRRQRFVPFCIFYLRSASRKWLILRARHQRAQDVARTLASLCFSAWRKLSRKRSVTDMYKPSRQHCCQKRDG